MAIYATAIGFSNHINKLIINEMCSNITFPMRVKLRNPIPKSNYLDVVDSTGEGWPYKWFIYKKKEK